MTGTASIVTHERLGDLFDFQNGRGFKKSEWSQKGLPIIRIQNLNDPDAPFNRFNGAYSEDILVSTGDLLFSWSGTVGSSFGPHIWQRENGVLNQHIFKVLPKRAVDLRYAFYALEQITQDIEQEVSGSVGLVHITKKRLHEFTLPVPPLPEQRRIVAILDEAFEGIAVAKANSEKNLRNAKDVFESYRDATFASLQQEVALQPLIGMVDDISTGPFGSLLHKSDYEAGGIPLVNPINIEDDVIIADPRKTISARTAKRLSRYRLKAGDIAVGRRGDIGRCAVVSPEQEGWLCGTGCFVIRPGQGAVPEFLANLLRSRPYRMQLVAKAERATMPSISNKDLADLPVPIIPPAKQKKSLEGFIDLSAYSAEVENNASRKLTALDELKASLLHQAFTGQL